MRFALVAVLLLQVFFCRAQSLRLDGTVTDVRTKRKLDGASIFLGNTSIGTVSDAQGNFGLNNIPPGQYDLVVSMIGYEPYTQTLQLTAAVAPLQISLRPKAVMMPVVSVMSKAERERLLNMFVRDFVGSGVDAEQCRIENTDDIFLEYDRETNTLNASTEKFLVINNRPLGYRLKFLIRAFNSNYTSKMIYYEGQSLFEDMKGSQAQKKRWAKKRDEVYYGSPMHFYRSLITATTDHYALRRFISKPDPTRPPDSVIRAKLASFEGMPDSVSKWQKVLSRPKNINTLVDTLLGPQDVAARTNLKDIYALRFPDMLHLIYYDDLEEKKRAEESRSYPFDHNASIIRLQVEHGLFDQNGVVLDPHSVIYEGRWAGDRIGKMLPTNYQPLAK